MSADKRTVALWNALVDGDVRSRLAGPVAVELRALPGRGREGERGIADVFEGASRVTFQEPRYCDACGWLGDSSELILNREAERSEYFGAVACPDSCIETCPECGSEEIDEVEQCTVCLEPAEFCECKFEGAVARAASELLEDHDEHVQNERTNVLASRPEGAQEAANGESLAVLEMANH